MSVNGMLSNVSEVLQFFLVLTGGLTNNLYCDIIYLTIYYIYTYTSFAKIVSCKVTLGLRSRSDKFNGDHKTFVFYVVTLSTR